MRIAVLVVALLLTVACDPFGTERAAQAKRIEALEGQVAALTVTKAGSDALALDEKLSMERCLLGAEEAYWSYAHLNGHMKKGTEKRPGGPLWIAPTNVWEQAAREKQLVIDECRTRYASR